jgi:hypothetical protein
VKGLRLLILLFIFQTMPSHGSPSDKPALPKKYKEWVEAEVAYIITPKENRPFMSLNQTLRGSSLLKNFGPEGIRTRALP